MMRPADAQKAGEEQAETSLRLAERTRALGRSVLRELIGVVSRPGILSLAGGLPDPWLFPQTHFSAAMAEVLSGDARALQYGPSWGPLRDEVVRIMALRGVTCTADQVFVTSGAQQGLSLLAWLLLDQGSAVLTEEAIYTGLTQAVAPIGATHLTVPTDLDHGIDVDAVAWRLGRGTSATPAFLYVIPDGHNPLGVSVAPEARARLVELARRYRVPIVEDDPYGLLAYDGAHPPPLRALDDEWVIYVGSFSKIIAPALRLGWLVAPPALMKPLGILKEANDLESSALMSRAVAAYLQAGHLPGHLELLRDEYRTRRDRMLAALARHLPEGTRWTRPGGGFFTWVELPKGIDTMALLDRAVAEEKVAFVPGRAFTVEPTAASRSLRLSFSNVTPERIDEGVAALGRIVASASGSARRNRKREEGS
jgi:2-aminoadipate transaminase